MELFLYFSYLMSPFSVCVSMFLHQSIGLITKTALLSNIAGASDETGQQFSAEHVKHFFFNGTERSIYQPHLIMKYKHDMYCMNKILIKGCVSHFELQSLPPIPNKQVVHSPFFWYSGVV